MLRLLRGSIPPIASQRVRRRERTFGLPANQRLAVIRPCDSPLVRVLIFIVLVFFVVNDLISKDKFWSTSN